MRSMPMLYIFVNMTSSCCGMAWFRGRYNMFLAQYHVEQHNETYVSAIIGHKKRGRVRPLFLMMIEKLFNRICA
jgi:hypothetical protein